jgi:hypothetical protein
MRIASRQTKSPNDYRDETGPRREKAGFLQGYARTKRQQGFNERVRERHGRLGNSPFDASFEALNPR